MMEWIGRSFRAYARSNIESVQTGSNACNLAASRFFLLLRRIATA